MDTRTRLINLIAFLAVLGTSIALVATGVNPQSLAVIAVAITGLYGTWLNIDHHAEPRQKDAHKDDDGQEPR
jgi:uncharacterized membrane protein YqgA involved in biofilm formation